MKIVNSAISMTSQHAIAKTSIQFRNTNFWHDFERFMTSPNTQPNVIPNENSSSQKAPNQTVNFSTSYITIKVIKLRNNPHNSDDISDSDKQKLFTLERLLYQLFGKRFRFKALDSSNPVSPDALRDSGNSLGSRQLPGFNVIESNRFYQENEALSFEAKGIFKTADGKEINFNTDLNLSREFATLNNVNLTTGAKLIDPLVINYAGSAASLSNSKFSFDIDTNGQPEQISFLNKGSGFLALDLNNDQKINNGLELFGAKTGDGFNELANYDHDHNGWIDESDPIFEKLRIWTKDDQGNDQLFALGQKGIGAVYVGNITANFDYTNDNNQALGKNRGIGLFAKEDGKVGTVQEIDLVTA